MNITEVTTARKIGDFVLRQASPNKIDIKYLSDIGLPTLTDNSARIYLFAQDDIIKKIGGSASKGGIKATISFYVSAMTGSPGRPRFILHRLIEDVLRAGSQLELYLITSPRTLATVNGLFSSHRVKIASFKEMENLCKKDYFSREGRYPDWNFQENHESYPLTLEQEYNRYHEHRLRARHS